MDVNTAYQLSRKKPSSGVLVFSAPLRGVEKSGPDFSNAGMPCFAWCMVLMLATSSAWSGAVTHTRTSFIPSNIHVTPVAKNQKKIQPFPDFDPNLAQG